MALHRSRVATLTLAFAVPVTMTVSAELGYVKRALGDLVFESTQRNAYFLVYHRDDQTRGLAVLTPGTVVDIPTELKTFLKPKASAPPPSLSRDRTKLAFIQSVPDNDREQAVWVYDLRSRASHQIARFPRARSV